uniref:S1-like domain-containing protein n=1 Tax=viral metagenome TaxID=1070528 RepID=A0A6C0DRF9_9ZZZZ
MVKNSTGGKCAKSLARKLQTQSTSEMLQISTCELEQYSCVTKILGNGMCEIYTNKNIRLIGHIRNKMKGRNIRNNLVTVGSIVLAGLREWESMPKNCDILCVYDDRDVDRLKSMPNVDISHVLQLRFTNSNFGAGISKQNMEKNDDITFTNDIYDTHISNKIETTATTESFTLDVEEEINIDDI